MNEDRLDAASVETGSASDLLVLYIPSPVIILSLERRAHICAHLRLCLAMNRPVRGRFYTYY